MKDKRARAPNTHNNPRHREGRSGELFVGEDCDLLNHDILARSVRVAERILLSFQILFLRNYCTIAAYKLLSFMAVDT